MTVVPEGSALKKALCWASEARRDHPGMGLLALVDEAGMRFNLSPNESDALLRTLSTEEKKPT
ncbi:hypothetical protein DSLASN_38630 [Desulfoluna limicola]|uniref:Uncharacterized protein n=1 Tax=Desulfoluna limicola TaxID=2810562 RepID=A0ABM7PMB2_9BACT|nr:hypothetical protein [Desulfoluna limicola]BCS98231.1 hypothetical protein DSLASN_38630 [Desulfoluna limicola]